VRPLREQGQSRTWSRDALRRGSSPNEGFLSFASRREMSLCTSTVYRAKEGFMCLIPTCGHSSSVRPALCAPISQMRVAKAHSNEHVALGGTGE
jgi:hypothetical protein